MNEIRESEVNRFYRYCMIFFMHLSIVMGAGFLIVQLVLIKLGLWDYSQIVIVCMSFGFLVLGLYFRNRIARIYSLSDEFIYLLSGGKQKVLHKNDIISITKMVRFTLSERVWYIVKFINKEKKKENWLFQGEPYLKLSARLKKMGVKLKNIP